MNRFSFGFPPVDVFRLGRIGVAIISIIIGQTKKREPAFRASPPFPASIMDSLGTICTAEQPPALLWSGILQTEELNQHLDEFGPGYLFLRHKLPLASALDQKPIWSGLSS
jgi:hypothetical protein